MKGDMQAALRRVVLARQGRIGGLSARSVRSVASVAEQVASYHGLHQALLRSEVAGEVNTLHERLTTWSPARLSREGLSVANLRASPGGRFAGGQAVVHLSMAGGKRMPHHRFAAGDVVLISAGSPLRGVAARGVVLSASQRVLRVVLRDAQAATGLTHGSSQAWRVDVGWSDVTYFRMRDALAAVCRAPAHGGQATASFGRGPSWLLPLLLHTTVEHSVPDKSLEAEEHGCGKPVLPGGGPAPLLPSAQLLASAHELLQQLQQGHPALPALRQHFRSGASVPCSSETPRESPALPPLATELLQAKATQAPHAPAAPSGCMLSRALWREEAARQYPSPAAYRSAVQGAVDTILQGMVASAQFMATRYRVAAAAAGATSLEPALERRWKVALELPAILRRLPDNLNPSQLAAVAVALVNPLSIVHGPPGTGKTSTAACLLTTWIQHVQGAGGSRSLPILAVAPSNVAVDHLLQALAGRVPRILRVGEPARMGAKARALSIPEAMKQHAGYEHVKRLQQQAAAASAVLAERVGKRTKRARKAAVQVGADVSAVDVAQEALQLAGGDGPGQHPPALLRGMRALPLGELRSRVQAWSRAAKEAESRLARQVLQDAQVVLATANGAGAAQLDGVDFGLVLCDEAAQLHELDALVPLARAAERWTSQVVLMGDPKQLPPTVHGKDAGALTSTLLERALLAAEGASKHRAATVAHLQAEGVTQQLRWEMGSEKEEGEHGEDPELQLTDEDSVSASWLRWSGADVRGHRVALPAHLTSSHTGMATPLPASAFLQQQYRMSPLAAAWPSAAFYRGRLTSAQQNPSPPPGLPWPLRGQAGLAFVPVTGGPGESQASQGTSISNAREAGAVRGIVAALLRAGKAAVSPDDIGVIAPYQAQTKAISQALRRRGVPVEEGSEGGDAVQRMTRGCVEVRTVDGFQGREKRVIVLSTVRSNDRGAVGFLADSRRLNVALTRARDGLVVVGDPRTLVEDPAWASWLRWMVASRLVMTPQELGLDAAWDDAAAAAAMWEAFCAVQPPAAAAPH